MEQLGIEPKLLAAQLVNFSIILFVLTKLLYKPILSILEKRKKQIEEGLTLTEEMKAEEIKMEEKKEKLLEQARKDAHVIIEEGKKQAKDEEKEIIAKAHRDAEEVVEKAKKEIEHLREEMEKQMKKQTIETAVLMAKRLLERSLDAARKREISDKNIKELETFARAN